MSFGQDEPLLPPRRRSRWWWLGPLASALIFCASLVVLWIIVKEIEPGELGKAFANASLRQLGLALGFTALSYLLLTGYDALALKRLGPVDPLSHHGARPPSPAIRSPSRSASRS